MCEEGLRGLSLSLSMSLSPFLSLWGEAVNNAGGLADLCEPEALRKARVPGGDRQKEGPSSVQYGGWCHTGALGVWMMGAGCVPGKHAGHNPSPTATDPHPAPRERSARSAPQGHG